MRVARARFCRIRQRARPGAESANRTLRWVASRLAAKTAVPRYVTRRAQIRVLFRGQERRAAAGGHARKSFTDAKLAKNCVAHRLLISVAEQTVQCVLRLRQVERKHFGCRALFRSEERRVGQECR